jgi:hypothetical protein
MTTAARALSSVTGLRVTTLAVAIAGGAVLGVAYTLSPLLVWFLLAFVLLCRGAIRDLSEEERRAVLALLIAAAVLRLAVVAGLFVATDHWSLPFGSLFGDEEYFKRRSLWLRSMALDVNISAADRRYAVDEYSDVNYLYVLALVQVLVGAAPYGIHLLSIWLHLAACVLLLRVTRRAYGFPPAILAFGLLLFFPSLFLWSTSALRESLHFLLVAIALVGLVEARQAPTWPRRAWWIASVLLSLFGLKDLRAGSTAIVAASIALGFAAAVVTQRIRRILLAVALVVLVTAAALSRPAMQHRLLLTIGDYAMNHTGHVFTPGLSYKLLGDQYYIERSRELMASLPPQTAVQFVVRAVVAAIVVPVPWNAQSNFTRAYLPEYFIWLALVALLPVGVVAGRRYAADITLIFASYIAIMGLGVAIRSGNIGTLVRHRGLFLPFMIVLGSVALCHLFARRGRAMSSSEHLAAKEGTA